MGEFPIYEKMSIEERNLAIEKEKERCAKLKNWADVYAPDYNQNKT